MAPPARTRAILPSRVLLLVLLSLRGAASLYPEGGPVPLLTAEEWGAAVKHSPVPVLVQFYVDWDGHCKEIAPAYTGAATQLQGIVPLYAVSCQDLENPPICKEHNIKRVPSILMYQPGNDTPVSLNIPLSHPMKARSVRDAALGLLTEDHVKHFHNQTDAVTWLEAPGTKVVLVWTDTPVVPWIKSLSQRYAKQLRFAQVERVPEGEALLEHYGIDAAPYLAALTADHRKVEFKGPLKAPLIEQWLLKLIAADHSSGALEAGGDSEGRQGDEL